MCHSILHTIFLGLHKTNVIKKADAREKQRGRASDLLESTSLFHAYIDTAAAFLYLGEHRVHHSHGIRRFVTPHRRRSRGCQAFHLVQGVCKRVTCRNCEAIDIVCLTCRDGSTYLPGFRQPRQRLGGGGGGLETHREKRERPEH